LIDNQVGEFSRNAFLIHNREFFGRWEEIFDWPLFTETSSSKSWRDRPTMFGSREDLHSTFLITIPG
jgi:hypothetical protein